MNDDATCYVERSKVREIVIGHNAATQAVLPQIDALQIFVAADFRIPTNAQAPNDAISAVMTEAYGMLGLELTSSQARRLANAALSARSGDVAAGAWQPISTAPVETAIMLWYPWQGEKRDLAPDGFIYIGRWTSTDSDGTDGWRDTVDYELLGEGATHWKPLPAGPSVSSTHHRRPDETGEEYEARVGLLKLSPGEQK